MVAEIGGPARSKGEDGHEAADLAPRRANRVDESATGVKAAEPVDADANLEARACAVGEKLHEATAGRIATEDEGGVDGVPGRQDLAPEFAELSFARRKQAKGFAAKRGRRRRRRLFGQRDGTNKPKGLRRPEEESA